MKSGHSMDLCKNLKSVFLRLFSFIIMNLNLDSGTYSFFCDSVSNQMEAVVGKPSLSCLVVLLSRACQETVNKWNIREL